MLHSIALVSLLALGQYEHHKPHHRDPAPVPAAPVVPVVLPSPQSAMVEPAAAFVPIPTSYYYAVPTAPAVIYAAPSLPARRCRNRANCR